MTKSLDSANQGDIIVLDIAVFHSAGVEGAHHVEESIEYVLMDEPVGESCFCVLTVDQEESLGDSIASNIYTLNLNFNSEQSILSHPNVKDIIEVRDG